MAPTPFNETSFQENLLTSLIPIQHKSTHTSNSHLCRNQINGSTRTDVQGIFTNSLLKANKEFEDFAESHRNMFSNNFKNQLNKLDIGTNKTFEESIFTKPSNDFHIIRKGPFFQDPFFEECRRQFEKSVKDIVNKFDLMSSLSSESSSNSLTKDVNNNFMKDAFKSYRNLRDTHLQEENQAASLIHEDHQHKIVIDVKDFMDGDVKINSFNNTIRIEGHQEASSQSPKNSSSSRRNFCKEFTLPGSVNMDSVKSTMSSDGILTITVPRSQPESTARLSFPRESDMKPSPSQISQSPSQISQSPSEMTHLPSHITQSSSQMTHSPSHMTQAHSQMTHQPPQSERHLTIQELPSDGHTDTNGTTSHNYVTYPEEVNGATCQSYSRNPAGGYWKR